MSTIAEIRENYSKAIRVYPNEDEDYAELGVTSIPELYCLLEDVYWGYQCNLNVSFDNWVDQPCSVVLLLFEDGNFSSEPLIFSTLKSYENDLIDGSGYFFEFSKKVDAKNVVCLISDQEKFFYFIVFQDMLKFRSKDSKKYYKNFQW